MAKKTQQADEKMVFSMHLLEGKLSQEIFSDELTLEEWQTEYAKGGKLTQNINKISRMEIYPKGSYFRATLNGQSAEFKSGKFGAEVIKIIDLALASANPKLLARPVTRAELVKANSEIYLAPNNESIFGVVAEARKELNHVKNRERMQEFAKSLQYQDQTQNDKK